ncbi:hypothetical protein PPSIR1_39890 [Plesiocystis pacifica SIR-1]|uniref:Hydrogenase maturation nickel metallochaperone HypA n=1 Tax=Plesiocystis pacifica SIR-1 TaxID=391625 RepID=A6FYA8_9BACT|nr:hydrogenase/urease maturation nickel metallochaperone HypA [Plesiocystis pacifica]EDM81487.1 hypothetical protein PPSIR1_39890 [Plesiocystis pacifica SIR-1]
MHESGLIQALIDTAEAEAATRRAQLVGIELRLGVLAGGSPAHLREHFEHECARRGLAGVELDIRAEPDYPGGIEITGLSLRPLAKSAP